MAASGKRWGAGSLARGPVCWPEEGQQRVGATGQNEINEELREKARAMRNTRAHREERRKQLDDDSGGTATFFIQVGYILEYNKEKDS